MLSNHFSTLYQFRDELIKCLLEKNYKVVISNPPDEKNDYFRKLGCEVIETKLDRRGTNPIRDYKLILMYRQILKEVNPNVVLSFTIKPNLYGGMASAKFGIPYIANITGLGQAVEKKGILREISILMYKWAFRKIDCVFVQNEKNKQFFIDKNIAKDKLKLIPGSGVNLGKYQLMDYPKDKVEFVFISRIMKAKGIDHYLEAAEYFHNRNEEIIFHVCGFCEEEYERKLKELEEQGVIKYHGMVDDIREVLKDVSATIHPTYYPEGLSNVLLESAACGRPIITTDRSGCREVIEDGENGYMIKQKDTESLINAIEKFLELSYEDRLSMGMEGRKKVEREFDREIVVKKYLEEIAS